MNSRPPDIQTPLAMRAQEERLLATPSECPQLSAIDSSLLEAEHLSPGSPKYRSDLAIAAGFAGLACLLFRFSLIPLIFDLGRSEVLPAIFFFLALPLPGLPAPLALWLGMKACADLRSHPGKSGWVPTTVGLTVGFLGTLVLLFETYQVARALYVLGLQ